MQGVLTYLKSMYREVHKHATAFSNVGSYRSDMVCFVCYATSRGFLGGSGNQHINASVGKHINIYSKWNN